MGPYGPGGPGLGGPGWGPGPGGREGRGWSPGPGGPGWGPGPGGPGWGMFGGCFYGICDIISSCLSCLSCCWLAQCCFGGFRPFGPPYAPPPL